MIRNVINAIILALNALIVSFVIHVIQVHWEFMKVYLSYVYAKINFMTMDKIKLVNLVKMDV